MYSTDTRWWTHSSSIRSNSRWSISLCVCVEKRKHSAAHSDVWRPLRLAKQGSNPQETFNRLQLFIQPSGEQMMEEFWNGKVWKIAWVQAIACEFFRPVFDDDTFLNCYQHRLYVFSTRSTPTTLSCSSTCTSSSGDYTPPLVVWRILNFRRVTIKYRPITN